MNQDNLLLLVPSLKLGGQERVTVHTAAMLAQTKHVSIAVFDSRDAVYTTDVEVIDLNLPAGGNLFSRTVNVFRRVRALKKLKKERNINCTFSFGDTANLANVLSRAGDRVVLSVRGYGSVPTGKLSKIVWHFLYQKADLVLCVAKKLTSELVRACRLTPEKVTTVYNPYNMDQIRANCEEASPVAVPTPSVVGVGRLQNVKGYRHLIRAVKLAGETIPNLHLVLVGDGTIQTELYEEACRCGIQERVCFAGFQKNPFAIVSKSSCYVLSSISEGFPNAMVEAMACGVPAIAVDCETGPREILDFDETETIHEMKLCEYGILCPAFTSDFSEEPQKDRILADAIVRMLTDERLHAAYCARAEFRAKMFSFEQYRDRLIEVLFTTEESS